MATMQGKHRAILEENRGILSEGIDLESRSYILQELLQENIITIDMKERIMSQTTKQDKVHSLLNILITSGPEAFLAFLNSLKKSYSYLFVALKNRLQEEEEDEGYDYFDTVNNIRKHMTEVEMTEPLYMEITENESRKFSTGTDLAVAVPQSATAGWNEEDTASGYSTVATEMDNTSRHYYQRTQERNCPIIPMYKNLSSKYISMEPNHECFVTLKSLNADVIEEDNVACNSTFVLEKGEVVLGPIAIPLTNHDPVKFHVVMNNCGMYLVVLKKDLKIYGDPAGEPWYLPARLMPQQANNILKSNESGTFVVYKTTNINNSYHISLSEGHGKVTSYAVIKKDSMFQLVDDEGKRFTTIKELVDYYRMNCGPLACRLWKSPRELMVKDNNLIELPDSLIIKMNEIEFGGFSLGRGNFGRVQKGSYKMQPVAVKMQRVTKSRRAKELYLQEAVILNGLDNTNIVKLIGVCVGVPQCIVMEFMPGENLCYSLREGIIDFQKNGLPLCMQIFSALVYLMEHCILHRDVATRNCLLDLTGHLVKLSDFGLACKVERDIYIGDSDEKIAVCWSSPEVLQKRQFSIKSDIWAAGVLMWEIWSGGRRPLRHISKNNRISFICSGRSNLLLKPEGCKDEIYDIMESCWEHQPENRPDSKEIYEFLVDLLRGGARHSRGIKGFFARRKKYNSNVGNYGYGYDYEDVM